MMLQKASSSLGKVNLQVDFALGIKIKTRTFQKATCSTSNVLTHTHTNYEYTWSTFIMN